MNREGTGKGVAWVKSNFGLPRIPLGVSFSDFTNRRNLTMTLPD